MDKTKSIRHETEDMRREIDRIRQSGQCTGTVNEKIQAIEAAVQEIVEACDAFAERVE